jgi:hypothetical protein
MPSTVISPVTPIITFWLAKKVNSPESQDDQIRISYNPDLDLFEVALKDKQDSGKETWYNKVYGQTRGRTMRYVWILLKSLTLDEDGYERIQVDVPGLPQFLTRVSNLRDLYVRQHIEEMVELGLDLMWDGLSTVKERKVARSERRYSEAAPLPPSPAEDNPRRPSHIFFTDDE